MELEEVTACRRERERETVIVVGAETHHYVAVMVFISNVK